MDRKLVAILAADVVGYSKLMADDEEFTLQQLKAHRSAIFDPAVKAHNGRIIKLMGDGTLVEFASVVDAVKCSIAIQKATAASQDNIQLRIGINLGDVIVEGDDIFGDGVNVAARLEQLAKPGSICLSGTAYDTIGHSKGMTFESLGEVHVKNIDRQIRAYNVILEPQSEAVRSRLSVSGKPGKRLFVIGAVLTILLGFATIWYSQTGQRKPQIAETDVVQENGKLSIAVLPFTNLSQDADQEYFVDGMTDDLITDLSKLSSLFVIARNTVFTFKGRNVEPKIVAQQLGVQYILNGSVRAASGRVRINAHLIDASSGGQIWAERFDQPVGDIFELQDEVTKNIVAALALKISPEEKARISHDERKTKPEVYDLYLRGVQALRQFTPEGSLIARSLFLQALSLDPDYARAHATLAFAYIAAGTFYQEKNIQQASNDALRYARRAIELDETLPQGHFALAIAHLRQSNHSEALQAARNAVRYDPNYADGYVALANVLVFIGEGSEALSNMKKAMELNPRYSAAYLDINGRAYFMMSDYEKAIESLKACVARDPVAIACRAFLASAYALSGRITDAEWEAIEVLQLEPDFRLGTNNISVQFKQPEDREKFQSGLNRAGITK